MMIRYIAPVAAAIIFPFAVFGGLEATAADAMTPVMHGELKIEQPWTRATPPGAKVAGGYLTITNMGGEADTLVAVTTPRAEKAEIHEMKMDGGIMTMRPLGDGLVIAPGATVVLEPGGVHLMLMKLDSRIEKGSSVPMTLTFEQAGAIKLEFTAAPIGAKKPVLNPAGGGG
jgi:copper(I)-binding protein